MSERQFFSTTRTRPEAPTSTAPRQQRRSSLVPRAAIPARGRPNVDHTTVHLHNATDTIVFRPIRSISTLRKPCRHMPYPPPKSAKIRLIIAAPAEIAFALYPTLPRLTTLAHPRRHRFFFDSAFLSVPSTAAASLSNT